MADYPPLTDASSMPFGKTHKGKLMIDVPVSWFVWFQQNGSPGTVMDYIEKNWGDIEIIAAQNPYNTLRNVREGKNFESIPSTPPPKTGPISTKEIEDLITKRSLNLNEVIDAYIRVNYVKESGLEILGNALKQTCLKHIKKEAPKQETFAGWDLIKEEDLPF